MIKLEIIRGNKRSTHVPYPRWFALVLQYVGIGYGDDQAVDWIHSFTSSKLFNHDPDNDWNITKGMQKWVNTQYKRKKLPYVASAVLSDDEIIEDESHSMLI